MEDENQNDVAELAPFDPTKEKKKKKVVIQDAAVNKLDDKTDSLSVSEGLESTFTGSKKKKKKPVEASILNEETGNSGENLDVKKLHFINLVVNVADRAGENEEAEGAAVQPC
ncbi:eukaryotic translation initiation factor 2 subunit beta-like [Pistacia vera]|uniref:eukaryotic translation initiation factor 2 subunit beta-like n=1 Tax=Pistacia vera TaxID=55513 RepID=UPI0012639964|nr:eukaryotic translation initiation factor 2 subunit beta-like [Pistacia vera]